MTPRSASAVKGGVNGSVAVMGYSAGRWRRCRDGREPERSEGGQVRGGTDALTRFGVARLRRRLGLSQAGFARRFGVPLATLRQCERGVRRPTEPARVLLQLIADAPALVEEAAAKLAAG